LTELFVNYPKQTLSLTKDASKLRLPLTQIQTRLAVESDNKSVFLGAAKRGGLKRGVSITRHRDIKMTSDHESIAWINQ